MTPSSEKTAPKLTRFLTFSIFVKNKNYKTARTKLRFSQQPSKLGIKVRGVLKSENHAKKLLIFGK